MVSAGCAALIRVAFMAVVKFRPRKNIAELPTRRSPSSRIRRQYLLIKAILLGNSCQTIGHNTKAAKNHRQKVAPTGGKSSCTPRWTTVLAANDKAVPVTSI